MSAAAPVAVERAGVAAFPWDDLFRLAVLEAGISPRDFWRMSVREVAVLLTPAEPGAAAAMTRFRLERLMETFPDD